MHHRAKPCEWGVSIALSERKACFRRKLFSVSRTTLCVSQLASPDKLLKAVVLLQAFEESADWSLVP